MNDWSNDSLAEGDLVEVLWETGYMYLESAPKLGLVLKTDPPARGSLQVYNVKLMVDGREMMRPRHSLRKLE